MPDRPLSEKTRSGAEEFIRSQPAEGTLSISDGRRVAALPETLLRALHRGLAESGSDQIRLLLYRAGYEWGLQDMLQLSRRMREEPEGAGNAHIWKMDATFVLERWSAPFAAAGWGACIFDLSSHAKGLMFVELRHSVSAAVVGQSRAPVCHLYAGLFAGALSFYDRSESHAVETECTSLGHACCRFIIGPGPLIDQAESARHSGVTHDAIRRMMLEARAPEPNWLAVGPGAGESGKNSLEEVIHHAAARKFQAAVQPSFRWPGPQP